MHILVATLQTDLRLAIELYLAEEPGIDIVGTASEAASLRALVRTARPDLIVLDWGLPGHSPTNLIAEIKKSDSDPQIIVLGRKIEQSPAILAAGANAFVLKGDPPGHLLAAVRRAQLQRSVTTDHSSTDLKGD